MPSLLMLLTACEARISGTSGDVTTDATETEIDAGAEAIDAAAKIDAPIDAVVLGPWSTPAKILAASTTGSDEDDSTLSSNALELIFAIDSRDGKDLYYSSRPSAAGAWTTAVKLPFNTTKSDETPRLSADDKTLYFASDRNGTLDVYTVTRAAAGSTTWGTPQALATVNTNNLGEKWYMPCGTNHYIMAQSVGDNDSDLVEGTIGSPPTAITTLNSPQAETGTLVTPDCLTIYFASKRANPTMIYTSHRATLTAPWQPPTAVTDFKITGGNGNQEDPWMSPDGRTFVFASDAAGSKDIYISTR